MYSSTASHGPTAHRAGWRPGRPAGVGGRAGVAGGRCDRSGPAWPTPRNNSDAV
ncbi:hypothetical protein Ae406Ps2_3341c [Pseudonocardia sp. Ae406_Ps2]|nr:hypothetical protein Ae331Ps2_2583 [Pseudonocardia sp. Ae331_Ps2]OLM03341.1 hypothetical protein Ae406Ps2_3341c [Pseudonocardia sp. Ae406_Ps2]OLM24906.1 hypothetical protein Ae706Ps2_3339c [Pseudonocardia sp. Ae706_Ps2]